MIVALTLRAIRRLLATDHASSSPSAGNDFNPKPSKDKSRRDLHDTIRRCGIHGATETRRLQYSDWNAELSPVQHIE